MNTTSPQQVDTWLSSPSEHQRLEFKEAKNHFDNEKLYRYCVAIANEGGGQLLLGVTDVKPRQVVGSHAFNNPIGMQQFPVKADCGASGCHEIWFSAF